MTRSTPTRDSYDVIVVGAGIGGLSAASVLARAGQSVLLVERTDGVGGYAHVFSRGDYRFDPAVHWTTQTGQDELYGLLLKWLGVEEQWRMIELDTSYDVLFPGFRMRVPVGFDELVAAHVERFPHEEAGIQRLFDLCLQMHREVHRLSMGIALKDLDAAVERAPVLFKYRMANVAQVLDECLTDPRAKSVCGASWPYAGSPPSRLGFLTWAQTLMNQMESCYFCEGSFQNFVDPLASALELHGGDLVVSNGARSIDVEGGKVVGVTLQNGEQVRAPIVVSNADAFHTFEDLVGVEHLPERFMVRLRRMDLSTSAFVVFAATSLDVSDLDLTHETFINTTWDHEETWRDINEGRPGGVWINMPTLTDPSLAPEGEHLVIISSLAAYDVGSSWDAKRERFTELLLDLAEQNLPRVRDSLTYVESATPLTLERYTLNKHGAMYGWENTAAQTGTKRLAHESPLPGLYMSSHWSIPGSSSLRVLTSGVHTAMIILRKLGVTERIPLFQEANLPTT